MATIEERAYQYAVKTDKPYSWFCDLEKSYIAGATEQDRIARQEERARCIRLAQDAVCKVCASCYNITNCKKNGCGYFNSIRKAIEEGGSNDKDK